MLEAGDRAPADFLSESAEQRLERLLDAPEPGDSGGPDRLGPWRLGEELGQGGMGVIYAARRADGAYEREVAIKLLRVGLDDDLFLAHFERERRILARLDHPAIARLEDAGVTEDGRPYFVMERVTGETITAACARRSPELETRIRWIIEVGEAVQYAHRNLVLHRDLKPANILVTDDGRIKLLDFGIARLLEEDGAAEATRVPSSRTPAYAAPEQVRGESATTASDLFNLGLLLAEVLTGEHPFRLRDASSREIERRLLDDEPSPPSELARRTGREALARELAGDLDDIVLCALRREPAERYPSADAFVEDLRRYLDSRPVHASRGKSAYRLRKYVRRHRIGVAVAGAATLSLLVGLGSAAWQARRASRERDRARGAEARALAINAFLVDDLLSAAAPENARGRPVTVLEVLDGASRRVETAFRGEEETRAAVRSTLGRTYLALGAYEPARRHLEAAERTLRERYGAEDPRSLRARAELADALAEEGRLEQAETMLEAVLEAQRRELGPENPQTLDSEILLARLRSRRGDYGWAERALRRVLAVLERAPPSTRRSALSARTLLAEVLGRQLRFEEMEVLCEQTLKLQREVLGDDHPDLGTTLMALAMARLRLEKLDEAETAARDSLELRERVLGPEHPSTLATKFELGRIQFERDDWAGAERTFREVLAVEDRVLGLEHPERIVTLTNVGIAVRFQGRFDEAERIYREVVELNRRIRGETHPETLRSLRNLVGLYDASGEQEKAARAIGELIGASETMARSADADPTALNAYAWFLLTCEPERLRRPRRALELAERAVAGTGRGNASFLDTLAHARDQVGDLEGAIAVQQEAVALPDGISRTDLEAYLIELLERAGDTQAIDRQLAESLARRRAERPPDDPLIGVTLRRIGRRSLERGEFARAEKELRESLRQLRLRLPDSNYRVAIARSDLAEALVGLDRRAEAERELVAALAALEAHPEATREEREETRERLAALRRGTGSGDSDPGRGTR